MMSVAFFRNLNQGQRGHLGAADLQHAFAEVGAREVHTFQSNGTVVFEADEPDAVGQDVHGRLAARGLFDDVVIVRALAFVEDIVDSFTQFDDVQRHELTLFAGDGAFERTAALPASVTVAATRRRCAVVAHGPGWALVRNDRDGQSNGTPTIEAAVGSRATSRGLPTLLRLVKRFSR
ncbi:MAG: DUF1697 domain-containing protein [Microbacterium sp.]